jgi:ribosome-associated protein
LAATKTTTPSKTTAAKPKLRSSHGASLGATTAKKTAKKTTSSATTAEKIVAAAKRRAVVAKTTPPVATKEPARKKAKVDRLESVASDEARRTAMEVAIAAFDKKAAGIEILDVAGKVDYADFLVLMTGRSERQVAALAGAIEAALRVKEIRAISIEGLPNAQWVLMDFGDVVVHIFQEETRGLYDLDGLWMDASRLPVPASQARAAD